MAADWLGDIGPFQLAIALTVLAAALVLPWRENYGARDSDSAAAKAARAGVPSGLAGAWGTVRKDPALLLTGATFALFEGSMYCWVFNWVPSLAGALGGWGALAPVQGLLFSCLMTAIMIGGEVYSYAASVASPEKVGVAVYALAAASLAAPVFCQVAGCGALAFEVHLASFLLFEACVGMAQPCIATHRTKYIDETLHASVRRTLQFLLLLHGAEPAVEAERQGDRERKKDS